MVSETTSVWVLPVIPLIVLSATGGLMSQALIPHSKTLASLTTCFALTSLCIGMGFTLMVITLYLTRLILRGPPLSHVIMASFIITSPLGTGGYSLLLNGQSLAQVLPQNLGPPFPTVVLVGQIIYTVCFMGTWILWSMAFGWIILSILSVMVVWKTKRTPFTLAYWGLVFPNGVFAICSVRLGLVLDSPFFHYFGAIWSSELKQSNQIEYQF